MSELMIRISEGALRRYIEEAIQSETGLTAEDEKHIAAERQRIANWKKAA